MSVPAVIVFWAGSDEIDGDPRPLGPTWRVGIGDGVQCRAAHQPVIADVALERVMKLAQPVRFSMLERLSPSASPPEPIPVIRLAVMPAAKVA